MVLARRSLCKWDAWFAKQGIVPFAVTYEQLVADYSGTVRAVLALLGESVDEVPPPRIQRQGSSLNTEWAERFRNERPQLA